MCPRDRVLQGDTGNLGDVLNHDFAVIAEVESLDGTHVLTQNVGRAMRSTDDMSQKTKPRKTASQIRAAGIASFFRPRQLEEVGMTRHQIRALMASGEVERVSRGLYRLTDAEPTENYSLAMVCALVPDSIVCLLSALRVHDIGTQSPADIWLAIPNKARMPRIEGFKLRILRFSGASWTFGIQETSFEGVPARITSPARTVTDAFRFERLVGPEIAMEALQDSLRRRKVTIGELTRLAEKFPSRRLKAALDVRSI